MDEQEKSAPPAIVNDGPIAVGIGANLAQADGTPPLATCEAAVTHLNEAGVTTVARSRWYRSSPVPPSGMPPFVNGAVLVSTALPPAELLALLHRIEDRFGRRRPYPLAPRTLDLDLLIYGDRVSAAGAPVALPHPRLAERAFVLKPLLDVLPDWRHPVTGGTVLEMLSRLRGNQYAELLS